MSDSTIGVYGRVYKSLIRTRNWLELVDSADQNQTPCYRRNIVKVSAIDDRERGARLQSSLAVVRQPRNNQPAVEVSASLRCAVVRGKESFYGALLKDPPR